MRFARPLSSVPRIPCTERRQPCVSSSCSRSSPPLRSPRRSPKPATHPARTGKHPPPPRSVWTASSLEIDRLGPKHVPLHHPYSAAPVEANRPGRPQRDRDRERQARRTAGKRRQAGQAQRLRLGRRRYRRWRRQPDAGAGRGLALLVTRRSRGTSVPERSELAGLEASSVADDQALSGAKGRQQDRRDLACRRGDGPVGDSCAPAAVSSPAPRSQVSRTVIAGNKPGQLRWLQAPLPCPAEAEGTREGLPRYDERRNHA